MTLPDSITPEAAARAAMPDDITVAEAAAALANSAEAKHLGVLMRGTVRIAFTVAGVEVAPGTTLGEFRRANGRRMLMVVQRER